MKNYVPIVSMVVLGFGLEVVWQEGPIARGVLFAALTPWRDFVGPIRWSKFPGKWTVKGERV